MTARITVVTGAPCSGKTTYIDEHRDPLASVVIDLDQLAHALGYPTDHLDPLDVDHPARAAAYAARGSVLKRALAHQLDAPEIWIIDSNPTGSSLAKYRQAGATLVNLNPGPDVCHQRATDTGRPTSTHSIIDAWQATTFATSTSRRW